MNGISPRNSLPTNPVVVLLIWLVALGVSLYFVTLAIDGYQKYRAGALGPSSITLGEAVTLVPEIGDLWVTIADGHYQCEHIFTYSTGGRPKTTYTVVPIFGQVDEVIALVRTPNAINCIEESKKPLSGRLSRIDRAVLNELYRYGFDLPNLRNIQRIFLYCPNCSPANDLMQAIGNGFYGFILLWILVILTRHLIKVL